ncbi:UNVERIFIED_CONTAM: hypothetical protein NCL1_20516 [Trichonephila clavipes]
MAYYVKAKRMLGERRFVRLRSLMRKGVEPNPDGFYIFSEITRLLINYPDLMKAFGMFLPPRFNLAFQSGVFLHLHQTVSTDKQAAAVVKGESKEMPSTSSNEQMVFIFLNINFLVSKIINQSNIAKSLHDGISSNHPSKEYHILVTQNHFFMENMNCDQIDIGSDVLQEVLDLFHGHDDLIDEFKSFIPNTRCESPEDVCNVFIFFFMCFFPLNAEIIFIMFY